MSRLRIASRVESSAIYGPGDRAVIWLQGCTLGCRGCWNREYWPEEGGSEVTIDELLAWIVSIEGIEGISLLGGEPLEQAGPLSLFLQRVRESGLSVVLWTGFEPEELDERQHECLMLSDIAIVGRYMHEERDLGLRWRGSANQRILAISDLYSPEHWEEETHEVEIHIGADGRMTMLGYPEKELLDGLEGIPMSTSSGGTVNR